MKYAIGIPTRWRTDILYKTIKAFTEQTIPPDLILVVDNNLNIDCSKPIPDISSCVDLTTNQTKVEIVTNDYDTPGIIQGDQTALGHFNDRGYKFAGRWDDDLVPDPDCMELLLFPILTYGDIATGGMYPGPGGKSLEQGSGFSRYENDKLVTGNGNPRHLQFFRWKDIDTLIYRHFLYSSFLYDIEKANLIGGFCIDYSAHSFRADTDFTLRLKTMGDLTVVTKAHATHYFCDGGTRNIIGAEKLKMKMHDLALFEKRMKSMGIDLNY